MLTLEIAYHALLGIVLALVVWAVGFGCLLLVRRDLPAGREVHAYPLGLLAVTVAALLFLLQPWLGLLGLSVVGVPLARLARERRGALVASTSAARALAWALPPTVAFAAAIGFLYHGPGADRDSSAGGELMFYVAKLVSAADSVAPFRDLLVDGQQFIFVEGAPSFLGATLSHLPGFDPFLFQTTALPAFMLASVCIGIGLLGEARSQGSWTAAVALLAVSMIAYPTWLTESPPVALAVPLVLSLYRLWAEPMPLGWFGLVGGAIAVDILLTKVVAGIPFALLVLAALYTRYRDRLETRHLVAAVVGLAAAAGIAIGILFLTAGWYVDLFRLGFLPADAIRELSTDNAASVGLLLEMAGQLLLLAAILRTREFVLALALAISIFAVWCVKGQGFDIAVGWPIMLAALSFWIRPSRDRGTRLLVVGAAVLLAVSAWFRDLAGVRSALVLVLLLGLALLAAFAQRPRFVGSAYALAATGATVAMAGHPYVGAAVLGLLALALAVRIRVVAVGFATAALAALVVAVVERDDFRLARPPPTLTSEDYTVWKRAGDVVPRRGLLFTSLTGKEIEIHRGWNNYPAVSRRQIYIAGWYDGRLISDPDERDRRLALNASVLSGATPPGRLDLSRTFDAYYAVLRRSERPPSSFRPVYENRLYALYRIS